MSPLLVVLGCLATPAPIHAADLACAGFRSSEFDRAYKVARDKDGRTWEGRRALRPSRTLDRAARRYAKLLAANGHFDHVGPDGSTLVQRVRAEGYCYRFVAENLALGDFTSARELVEGWMNSPGHRENMLHPAPSEYGLASACHGGVGALAMDELKASSLAELMSDADSLEFSRRDAGRPTEDRADGVAVFVMVLGRPCNE